MPFFLGLHYHPPPCTQLAQKKATETKRCPQANESHFPQHHGAASQPVQYSISLVNLQGPQICTSQAMGARVCQYQYQNPRVPIQLGSVRRSACLPPPHHTYILAHPPSCCQQFMYGTEPLLRSLPPFPPKRPFTWTDLAIYPAPKGQEGSIRTSLWPLPPATRNKMLYAGCKCSSRSLDLRKEGRGERVSMGPSFLASLLFLHESKIRSSNSFVRFFRSPLSLLSLSCI